MNIALKRSISLLLLFAMLSTGLSNYLIYAGFNLNRNYIASSLCINRAKPQMHCNGKCYLMKKLKEAEENEKKQEGKNGQKFIEMDFVPRAIAIVPDVAIVFLKSRIHQLIFSTFYLDNYIATIFRPPRDYLSTVKL